MLYHGVHAEGHGSQIIEYIITVHIHNHERIEINRLDQARERQELVGMLPKVPMQIQEEPRGSQSCAHNDLNYNMQFENELWTKYLGYTFFASLDVYDLIIGIGTVLFYISRAFSGIIDHLGEFLARWDWWKLSHIFIS